MNQFRIRNINTSDIPELLQIAEDCKLSPWSEQNYLDEIALSESIMLLIESNGPETVGFLVGRRVLTSSFEISFDAEIYNIGVKASFQKTGCGTLLINRFFKICKRSKAVNVWLDVRKSNNIAINFYKKNGFYEFSLQKNFYSNPVEDAMVMKLSI